MTTPHSFCSRLGSSNAARALAPLGAGDLYIFALCCLPVADADQIWLDPHRAFGADCQRRGCMRYLVERLVSEHQALQPRTIASKNCRCR
jgi:hypothetical protein